MSTYVQLQSHERTRIYRGLKAGLSIRSIALSIDRNPATVLREMKRNSDHIGYYPPFAQEAAVKRKARHGPKIERIPILKNYVIEKLNQGWPPIAIADRWSKENPEYSISVEAVYQYIYHPQNRGLELHKLLPRRKKKRGINRKARTTSRIPNRISIHERPKPINKRKEAGHFEADLIFHKESQSSNVLTIIERKSRFAIAVKNSSKSTDVVIPALATKIGRVAKTVTFDNGSEFSSHSVLTRKFGTKTYFCDPGSPWQKGSIENFNGITRRFLPFKVSSHSLTQDMIDHIVNIINHIPRKILKFKTPCEVFFSEFQKEIRACCTS